jgi:pimeloyl-ACP methyl ester carboxylesterase
MFLIFVAVFTGAAVFVALTYTRFHGEAQVRRARLLAGSDMLKTNFGASAGGLSATQFANDYPERTQALVLLSAVSEAAAPGDKPAFYVGIINLIQRSDYAYWLVAKFMRPTLLNLMGVPATVYARFTPVQKQLAQEMLDTMHPMTQRYRGTVNNGGMIQHKAASTDTVSAPTLILHGKDDALVSYHHAERAHEAIRESRLVSFNTGGHGLLSQRDAVRQNVNGFLERVKPKPRRRQHTTVAGRNIRKGCRELCHAWGRQT